MRKSLENKRNYITDKQIQEITSIYTKFEEGEYCRIFNNEDFGYTKVTIERPLRDDKGKIAKDNKGNPKPDSNLRDTESIPLTEDIDEYFKREVLPHVPNAWMDRGKDKVGYEISFTKYFYKYQPLRPLKDITADILALEKETEGLLKQIVEEEDM
jgi:type I restriction enzyme M protein